MELTDTLIAWRTDDDVAAVMITGGEQGFSAGLDLQLQWRARHRGRIGLIDRLVDQGEVVIAATAIAREIAETTTKSAMFNKELMLRSPATDPISALSFETSMYREVIWHPDVNERMEAAFSALRQR